MTDFELTTRWKPPGHSGKLTRKLHPFKELQMSDATPGSTVPSNNRTVMIVLSYLWLLALIPLLVEKEDKEVQWHAKHGLVLLLAEIVLWVLITMVNIVTGFFIGCLVGLLSLGLWVAIVILHIVCIVKGVNGQRLIIPGVSEYANKF
jgi:uncharacterized membrane protein